MLHLQTSIPRSFIGGCSDIWLTLISLALFLRRMPLCCFQLFAFDTWKGPAFEGNCHHLHSVAEHMNAEWKKICSVFFSLKLYNISQVSGSSSSTAFLVFAKCDLSATVTNIWVEHLFVPLFQSLLLAGNAALCRDKSLPLLSDPWLLIDSLLTGRVASNGKLSLMWLLFCQVTTFVSSPPAMITI